MNKVKMNDSVFEALFRQAVFDNVDERIASLPSEDALENEVVLSKRHIARMKRLLSNYERREHMKVITPWVRRTSAAVFLTVAVVFGALMTSGDVRAAVTQTIIQWFKEFTLFTSTGTTAPSAFLEPEYIPEGFIELDRTEDEQQLNIIFKNQNDSFMVFIASATDATSFIDSETMVYRELIVSEIQYYVFDATDTTKDSKVVWEIYGNRYIIIAPLTIDELIKTAQAVK